MIWRVDVNALHFSSIVREKGFECDQVTALNEQISAARFTDGKVLVVFEQVEGYVSMMTDNYFLSYPIECRHSNSPNEDNNLVPSL